MTWRWLRIGIMCLPAVVPAEDLFTFLTYEGNAYLPENNDFLYTEEYDVSLQGGEPRQARTAYRDSAGKIIAERTLDFTANSWAPDYRFEDFRTGRLEGSSLRDGKLHLYSRPGHDDPVREKTLRVPGPVVVDGGFTRFVHDHWDSLMTGEAVAFHFVAVSRLDWFEFEIQAAPDEGDADTGGTRTLVIRASNPLLRMLVPPILATFDAGTHRMLEYHGRSNIHGGDPVKLVYTAFKAREN